MALSFARDIRPMFRQEDVDGMMDWFDLSRYADVQKHAQHIHARVADGSMPCDMAWPAEQIARLQTWIDEGMQP